jgi:hypothetical protein
MHPAALSGLFGARARARGRFLALAVLGLAALLPPTGAQARTSAVLSYPLPDVWSTAVRFVRVDRGYPIEEKDEESGYILFDLKEGAKTYKASLELIRATDDQGRDSTRAAFTIPDLPRHFEVMLLDKLTTKVRDERGSPAPPPPRKPPPGEKPASPPDGGDGLPRPPSRKDLPR